MYILQFKLVNHIIRNCIIIFCTIYISSCIKIPRNYKYAKTPFSLNEYLKSTETKLDTSSFYFNEWVAFGEKGNVNIVDVLKFYSHGRFEFRTSEGQAFTKDLGFLNDFIHYYKIEKGILKLEVYGNSMEGFSYWKGNVYADSLVFFQVPGRRHIVYKKMK